MNINEFKEIWDICPTGIGSFWKKHCLHLIFSSNRNRYLPETLEKWFNEHLDALHQEDWISVSDELPLWTQIHIQPLDVDENNGKTRGRVYWIKHNAIKVSCYDKSLKNAIKEFLVIAKENNLLPKPPKKQEK